MDKRVIQWTPDSGQAADELSATEAAAALGVNQRTIRRAILRGELPAAKRAGVYRIAPVDLARYGSKHGRPGPPASRLSPDPPRLHPVLERSSAAPALTRPLTSLIGRQAEGTAVRDL